MGLNKFKAIIILSILFLFIIYLYIQFSLYHWDNYYYPYEIPIVRYCKIDSDCHSFLNTCVNKDFNPKFDIVTSFRPHPYFSEYNNFECQCSDYLVAGFCSKK